MKPFFGGKLSQTWVGGVADSQTPQNHPTNRLYLTKISPCVFPNFTKTLGWVFPKKRFFWGGGAPPLLGVCGICIFVFTPVPRTECSPWTAQ